MAMSPRAGIPVAPTLNTVPRPPAPTLTPSGGSLNQRLSQLAQAVSRKADVVTVPTYAAIILSSPNGTSFRVTVQDNGSLVTAQVPRP